MLREVHELKEQYPDDADMQQWFKDLKAPYERALPYADPDPALPAAKQEAARRKQQHTYEQELMQLCAHVGRTAAPMHTPFEWVERFLTRANRLRGSARGSLAQ